MPFGRPYEILYYRKEIIVEVAVYGVYGVYS